MNVINPLNIEKLLELSSLVSKNKASIIDKDAAIQVGQVGLGRIFPMLDYCSPTLKNDRELISYLVTRNAENLRVVDNKFKDDEEIVWAALKTNANSFEYASKRLKDNDDIVRYALANSVRQIENVPDRFGKDKKFIIEILKHNYESFQYINQEMKNDIDVLKEFWEHIKEKFYIGEDSTYHLWFFIEHMGERVKPFFSIVGDDKKTALTEVQTAFNNLESYLNLHKDLEKELTQSTTTQHKRIKL
jgi:hypothetical protein